jgi:hypothetical protein
MLDKELQYIYEQAVLLNEYSEGTLKRETERLKKQAGPHINVDTVRDTIKRFDQLKSAKESGNSIKEKINKGIQDGDIKPLRDKDPKEIKRVENLKKNPFEISLYTWNDLTFIVHQFREVETTKKTNTTGQATNEGTIVYENNDLKVIFGANKQETYAFKKKLYQDNNIDELLKNGTIKGTSSSVYGWCISYEPQRSLFDSYRYGNPPASVYFVIDKNLPPQDDRHVIVIHAQSDGKYRVTNAFNNREKVVDWSVIVSSEWQPKLQGLQEMFKFIPFTEQEELYRVVKSVTASSFHTIKFYRAKEAYINNPGSKILAKDFLTLEPALQHLYIHVKCPPNVADANINVRVNKAMHPFANTPMEEHKWYTEALLKVVDNLTEMSDEEYNSGVKGMEPLYDHPVIKHAKTQTYRLWMKIVNDVFDEYVNQRTEGKRGYND